MQGLRLRMSLSSGNKIIDSNPSQNYLLLVNNDLMGMKSINEKASLPIRHKKVTSRMI